MQEHIPIIDPREAAAAVKSKIAQRREKARMRQESLPLLLENTLKEINFPLLQELFQEHLNRSDVDKKAELVPPERITPLNLPLDVIVARLVIVNGTYTPAKENKNAMPAIQINIDELEKNVARQNRKGNNKDLKKAVLSVLAHEETHAVSGQEETPLEDGKESRVGFHLRRLVNSKSADTPRLVKHLYLHFNEGVTDKIAEEIYNEYLRRTGEFSVDPKQQDGYAKMYPAGREITDIVVRTMSEMCEVPEDVVWRGLVRGYFEGLRFDSPEMNELFSEVISPLFAQALKSADQLGPFTFDYFRLVAYTAKQSLELRQKAQAILERILKHDAKNRLQESNA